MSKQFESNVRLIRRLIQEERAFAIKIAGEADSIMLDPKDIPEKWELRDDEGFLLRKANTILDNLPLVRREYWPIEQIQKVEVLVPHDPFNGFKNYKCIVPFAYTCRKTAEQVISEVKQLSRATHVSVEQDFGGTLVLRVYGLDDMLKEVGSATNPNFPSARIYP